MTIYVERDTYMYIHCIPVLFENFAQFLQGSEHLILPLMAMVGELTRRQQELVKIIQSKDKEIDDYKSQGAKCSRSMIVSLVLILLVKLHVNTIHPACEKTKASTFLSLVSQVGCTYLWVLKEGNLDRKIQDNQSQRCWTVHRHSLTTCIQYTLNANATNWQRHSITPVFQPPCYW